MEMGTTVFFPNESSLISRRQADSLCLHFRPAAPPERSICFTQLVHLNTRLNRKTRPLACISLQQTMTPMILPFPLIHFRSQVLASVLFRNSHVSMNPIGTIMLLQWHQAHPYRLFSCFISWIIVEEAEDGYNTFLHTRLLNLENKKRRQNSRHSWHSFQGISLKYFGCFSLMCRR